MPLFFLYFQSRFTAQGMQFLLACLCLVFYSGRLTAQDDGSLMDLSDTTVYQIADQMPRFLSPCEQLDTTEMAKTQCAQEMLLRYIASRSLYPQEAREAGIQGSPVVTFVIEKDGSISQPKVVRDPGGQLGLAALQAVLQMQREARWIPARKAGQPIRFLFTLPIRFKLEDPKPYRLVGFDTVYVALDQALDYKGGSEALQQYFSEKLHYPDNYQDSCFVGQMDLQLLIQADNTVRILDLTDYNGLGFDFWYEAIHVATSSYGQWIPARFEGRAVPSAFDLSLNFIPTAPKCKSIVSRYEQAMQLASDANALLAKEDREAAIAKLDQAVELFPNDGQLLVLRGQSLLDANQLAAACVDLSKARHIALIDWFDAILPLICRPEQ